MGVGTIVAMRTLVSAGCALALVVTVLGAGPGAQASAPPAERLAQLPKGVTSAVPLMDDSGTITVLYWSGDYVLDGESNVRYPSRSLMAVRSTNGREWAKPVAVWSAQGFDVGMGQLSQVINGRGDIALAFMWTTCSFHFSCGPSRWRLDGIVIPAGSLTPRTQTVRTAEYNGEYISEVDVSISDAGSAAIVWGQGQCCNPPIYASIAPAGGSFAEPEAVMSGTYSHAAFRGDGRFDVVVWGGTSPTSLGSLTHRTWDPDSRTWLAPTTLCTSEQPCPDFGQWSGVNGLELIAAGETGLVMKMPYATGSTRVPVSVLDDSVWRTALVPNMPDPYVVASGGGRAFVAGWGGLYTTTWLYEVDVKTAEVALVNELPDARLLALLVDGAGNPALVVDQWGAPPNDTRVVSADGSSQVLTGLADRGFAGAAMNASGQAVATFWVTPPAGGAEYFAVPFSTGDSCVRVPSDGGPLAGAGARAGQAASTQGRQRFGPIEIAGCLKKDWRGRWTHLGDSVRMNGIDIHAKEGTVIFDPRASSVTFTRGSFEIRLGTFTPMAFRLTSPLTLEWGKNGTLDFDPGRYRALEQILTGKVSAPAGLPVLNHLGLSLKLAYDSVNQQGTASADFWVKIPLAKGAYSRTVPDRAVTAPHQGPAAAGVPVTRPAPTTLPTGKKLPTGAKATPGGACTQAEAQAKTRVNGRLLTCSHDGQTWSWGAGKVTFPARAGAPCSAPLDAGRPPIWRAGSTALSCEPTRKASSGQNYAWKAVKAPLTAREGQSCAASQVGTTMPARKPAASRSSASRTGRLVCAEGSSRQRAATRKWTFTEDSSAIITVSAKTTTDDGLLPLTISGSLQQVVLYGVEFSNVTLRYRLAGTDASGKPIPAEFAASGEAIVGPPYLPDALRTKIAIDAAWSSESMPWPTRLWLNVTRPMPLAFTPTTPPVPWLWFLSGGFGGEGGDSWQAGGNVRVVAGLPVPVSAGYADQDIYPMDLTGEVAMMTEKVTGDRTIPARVIYTGTMKILGFPTASARLEQQFTADGDISRLEVEGVIDIDPLAVVGGPTFVQAQGKVYGWYDPVNDTHQFQGYATVTLPTGRVTANALVSNVGWAICYSSGDDLTGWVYRTGYERARYYGEGCDVGLASPLAPPPEPEPETGDPDL